MVRKRNLWIRAAWCLVLIPLVVCLNHATAAVSPPKAKPTPEVIYVLVGPAAGTICAPGSPGENAIGKLCRLMLIHMAGVPGPVFEGKRVWATVPELGNAAAESTVAFFDVDRAEIWKQSTTAVDKWR